MKNRKYWIGGVCGLLLALFVFVLAADPSGAGQFLGRFHPLVVHLPIGLLLLAGVLELAGRRPALRHLLAAVPFVLVLGTASAVAAVVTGLLLEGGGGYDDGLIFWHKRLGLAVAVLAVVACTLHFGRWHERAGRARRAYEGVLVALFLLVSGAGHFGGMLTHGSGYLTDYLPETVRVAMALPPRGAAPAAVERLDEASVYDALVQPILASKCVSCHGADKAKGGLALDTPEAVQQGGEGGPVLVAGRAEGSELIRRLLLPVAHDDHMPPAGRPQVSLAEAELLRWWIDQGASFDQLVADAEPTPAVELILEAYGAGSDRPTGVYAFDVPAADAKAVAALEAAGATVTPLAEGASLLQVQFADGQAVGPEALGLLAPLAPQVVWLDLGGTEVTDDALAAVAKLEHLARLHLDGTAVTDAGLAHLARLPYLDYLNLFGTRVTDAGLRHLGGLPRLRHLYLWQTGVTDAGVGQLRTALPRLKVDTGLSDTTSVAVADTVAVAAGTP